MKISNFLSLNQRDFIRGLIVTVGTAALDVVVHSLIKKQLHFDWSEILTASLSAGAVYLKMNFLTGPKTATPAE